MTEYKTCSTCGEAKPATLEYFYRQPAGRDGLHGACKTCMNNQSHVWRQDNRESYDDYQREYYESHRESRNEYGRKHYEANRERIREQQRKYQRKYRAANPEKMREWDREHHMKRMQNVRYRVSQSISVGMWQSLRGGKNGRSWESLVGYTCADLMTHLESQFTKGMTWGNFGAWHIDHIVPQSWFNFESPEDPEFLECWSLWNLSPLWAFDNLSKGAKCDNPPLPLLHMERGE